MYFKHAVDAMGTRGGAAVTAAVAALLTSGLCRIVNGVAKELQHPFFTPVSQVSLPASPRHAPRTLLVTIVIEAKCWLGWRNLWSGPVP